MQAVNLGQIFHFLQKPSSPATITAAVEAGVAQNRLLTAEKVLLEQTLHGSNKVLTSVLALVSPSEFGHGIRLKRLVRELAEQCKASGRWQVEVTAMLLPLASLATAQVPAQANSAPSPARGGHERGAAMVAELLSPTPRLETVRQLLETHRQTYQTLTGSTPASHPDRARLILATSVLRVAVDFGELESESAGQSAVEAVETMSGREGRYAPEAMETPVALRGQGATREVRELLLSQIKAGMVFGEGVRTANGMLLVARGHEVTAVIVERLNNYPPRTIQEPLASL